MLSEKSCNFASGNQICTGCIIIAPSYNGRQGWSQYNLQLQGVKKISSKIKKKMRNIVLFILVIASIESYSQTYQERIESNSIKLILRDSVPVLIQDSNFHDKAVIMNITDEDTFFWITAHKKKYDKIFISATSEHRTCTGWSSLKSGAFQIILINNNGLINLYNRPNRKSQVKTLQSNYEGRQTVIDLNIKTGWVRILYYNQKYWIPFEEQCATYYACGG